MAKTVTIINRDFTFPTQGKAQQHYNEIVKNLDKNGQLLSSGQDFEDLVWIYKAYCSYTDYNLDRLKNNYITGFKWVLTVRENSGKHITTECCAVVFSDNSDEEFSINKAIKEIASKQNPR